MNPTKIQILKDFLDDKLTAQEAAHAFTAPIHNKLEG